MAHREIMEREYSPDLLFIELTKACDYSCVHCRASSISEVSPDEMKGYEIRKLLENLTSSMERIPHIIFTGGNPLLHPDFSSILMDALVNSINNRSGEYSRSIISL